MKILDHVLEALTAYYENEPPLTLEEQRITSALERPQREVKPTQSERVKLRRTLTVEHDSQRQRR